ncbi:MAG TPA: TraR/DksA C4-type zinc finger protein [Methylomirabilota bacterium]|nr:TraR/DksA C4-type zinc finger protein [Methylomirabilota bacterium]
MSTPRAVATSYRRPTRPPAEPALEPDDQLDPETIREAERFLRARLAELHASVRSSVDEQRTTEAVRAPDMTAAASATLLGEIQVALVDRRAQQIAQIEGALERLKRGQYGFCQECREFIGLARLRALPFAQRCRPCQGRAERRAPDAASSNGAAASTYLAD